MYSAWQQTLRTAVNLPAVTDADLAAATPGPGGGHRQHPRWAAGAGRWRLMLTGLVAAAIFGVFFLGKRQVGRAALPPSPPANRGPRP